MQMVPGGSAYAEASAVVYRCRAAYVRTAQLLRAAVASVNARERRHPSPCGYMLVAGVAACAARDVRAYREAVGRVRTLLYASPLVDHTHAPARNPAWVQRAARLPFHRGLGVLDAQRHGNGAGE